MTRNVPDYNCMFLNSSVGGEVHQAVRADWAHSDQSPSGDGLRSRFDADSSSGPELTLPPSFSYIYIHLGYEKIFKFIKEFDFVKRNAFCLFSRAEFVKNTLKCKKVCEI